MTQSSGHAELLKRAREVDRPYWKGAKRGELLLQRCLQCGAVWHPPSEFCPQCLLEDYVWKPVSGRGVIWGQIVMHQVYFKQLASEVPYNVVWIQLDEGPMVTANLVDAADADITVGQRVEAVFEAVTEDITLPRFTMRRTIDGSTDYEDRHS